MDILDPKDKEIFMNLCTDFAFKWVFGSERHKNGKRPKLREENLAA